MPLMLAAWLGPFIAYVVHRNKKVTIDETVFTAGHIRFWLSENLKVVGIKIAAEASRRGKGPPVELKAQGKDDRTNTANQLLARQAMGFPLSQALVAEAIGKRVDAVLMDFTQASVAMRYQIDGVWHDTEPRDRESGDAMLAVMKTLAGLDAKQRVKRQEGTFGAEHEKVKYTCRLVSQGTKTGERTLMQLQGRKQKLESLGRSRDAGQADRRPEGRAGSEPRHDCRLDAAGRRAIDAVSRDDQGYGPLRARLRRRGIVRDQGA